MKRLITHYALRTTLVTIFAFLLAAPLFAQSQGDTLQVANNLYDNGQFAEASQTYEQMVAGGVQSATVFYNLGNAYYQVGDLGRAILNYRRAQQLTPRDRDVRVNLALARSQTLDRVDVSQARMLTRWAWLTADWLTANELAGVTLAVWVLFWVLVVAWQRWRREWAQVGLVLLGLLVLVGLGSLGSRVWLDGWQSPAVVVAEEVGVLAGPGEGYNPQFNLHAGAEVGVIEERGDWVRVVVGGEDLDGWMPAFSVAYIQN